MMAIFIQPYNPSWKTAFEELQQVLNTALEDFEIDIQHIGSTAIPGLCAKPILDIDIILKDKIQLDQLSAKLERLGYKNKGDQGVPGRYAFRQITASTPLIGNPKKWQDHHLYVCFSDSLSLKNHLVFRDVLAKDKTLMNEYSQLKLNLANEKSMTREKYTTLKTDFIITVLAHNGLDEKEIMEVRKVND